MFLTTSGVRPITLTAAVLMLGSLGHANALEQQERNQHHSVMVVAQAETPSNSCARERTECLRARVQKGMLGSEYVPPDDAALCNAKYQACLSGQENAQPAPQPSAGHSTGNVLAGVRKFSIGPQVWEISGGEATYRRETRGPGADSDVETSRGTVSGNRIEGRTTRLYTVSGARCGSVVREVMPFSLTFSADTVAGEFRAGPVEVQSDTCKRGWAKMTEPRSFTAPWRKLE